MLMMTLALLLLPGVAAVLCHSCLSPRLYGGYGWIRGRPSEWGLVASSTHVPLAASIVTVAAPVEKSSKKPTVYIFSPIYFLSYTLEMDNFLVILSSRDSNHTLTTAI